ncbi:MAG: glycoside hydrolase family 127 protein [Clostridia bacterium]|nr:glycoside hydrolase family 127 protein [Clostridia bacterium]
MKYTAYQKRAETDVFFTPSAGSSHYEGKPEEMIRFTENATCMDPSLWALFVSQFRIGNTDDADGGWRIEYWGKMMRGACFTYAYTQNEVLYQILETTVRDLLTTQDEEGRITTYSREKEFTSWDMWGRKYVLLGLQYFLEICKDDALSDEILRAVCRQADYIMEKIGEEERKKNILYTSNHWEGLNSSSVLEPFVRLYHITNEKKYLDFSSYIIRMGGLRSMNIFEEAYIGKTYPYEYPVTKAYEMISNFEGILEYYRATGEEKYLVMAKNFARLVMDSDITVIGCAGTTHELFDHSRVTQFDPAFDGIMQETCVTVTWMKFCYQLLCLTGDAVYADQIEISMYNAFFGAINVNHNICKGQDFPFDSYSPLLNGVRGRLVGGYKDLIRNRFWWGCCVAIGVAGTGILPMTAAMKTENGIAVNLYFEGTYTQTLANGKTVRLITQTDYPKSGSVKMTLETDSEEPFTIRLRIPAWSKQTSLAVNGEPIKAEAGDYGMIERIWKNGDVIELALDMRVRILYAKEIDPAAKEDAICHFALLRGPVTLARDSALGENLEMPVTVMSTDGYVCATPTNKASFPTEQEYEIEAEEGIFTVVDYASAGQSWNKNLPITVWIKTMP